MQKNQNFNAPFLPVLPPRARTAMADARRPVEEEPACDT
jgi:hypothetical protein